MVLFEGKASNEESSSDRYHDSIRSHLRGDEDGVPVLQEFAVVNRRMNTYV
jgi:hypothetical protein